MIGIGAITVFALGLRHGADPDHIAAIDNLTRNSFVQRPRFSRLCGTLFAGGHSVMVLCIAALIGMLGSTLRNHDALIETIGASISIVVLIALALVNLRQIRNDGSGISGVKTRLLPRALREGASPWLALPVGLLFGFGFETSSQIATYSVAFGVHSGVWGALFIGSMFCLGMVCTDTLGSVLVHRLVSDRSSLEPHTMRVWIWSVTIVALAVAGYELAQLLGWQSPVPDLYLSLTIVVALLCVFAYVFATTQSRRKATLTPSQPTPTESALRLSTK